MKLKSAVKKTAIPIFEEHKYVLSSTDSSWFEFRSNDETHRIEIYKNRFPPASLRVDFRTHNLSFSHEDLAKNFGLRKSYAYTTQEELESMLDEIARATVQHVLPYLSKIDGYCLEVPREFYDRLSIETAVKARSFAKDHSLDVSGAPDKSVEIETILLSLRNKADSHRKTSFYENINEIVGAAAYLGEEIIVKKENEYGKWVWVDNEIYPRYELQSDRLNFDPLQVILNFWNYYPELPRRRIATFGSRKPLTSNPNFDNPVDIERWIDEIEFTHIINDNGKFEVLYFPDGKVFYNKWDFGMEIRGIDSFTTDELVDIYSARSDWNLHISDV